MSFEESENGFRIAGSVTAKALVKAQEMVHEGMPLSELCEKVEAELRVQGCEPAFPLNVSIDSVAAHYTPSSMDTDSVIPKSSVVKIDAGAHYKGYIADSAVTVSFNPDAERIVRASRESLLEALSHIRRDIRLGDLGGLIEAKIRSYGVNPIVDLTGHTIRRYELHAGVSVPNVANGVSFRFTPGVAVAIEPFTTYGVGKIKEDSVGKIFRGLRRVRTPTRLDERILEYALGTRKGMPFTDRWLVSFASKEEVYNSIIRLVRAGGIYEYKVLLEKSGGLVAQFEHTIFMSNDGPVVTTKREDESLPI
ncbi:type II methionyl aminopeptidase [Candidatus Marsarchaeota G2 archaeon ECH_B_2]|uniref:Type II methionyl aminopeptidase n=2 Tax=Candidatus Marsarchaeota group 2 TaxID=2203771 RepID=A0A2R6BC67_9ARCH|nr:MAG: type II methionyl aminopeptidase [Candidatus Marsarchaeota G2 archaeon ECH_B_2]PSO02808.1 MAG: type II methionyl aminopeptidase [Candidatus Marsarchaeota G2 archaeon ECH_B_1]